MKPPCPLLHPCYILIACIDPALPSIMNGRLRVRHLRYACDERARRYADHARRQCTLHQVRTGRARFFYSYFNSV